VARDSGLTRMGLYKALSKDGNPTLDTAMKVVASLGMRLSVQPVAKRKAPARRKAAAR
jgi:probable addiction module antidote protein